MKHTTPKAERQALYQQLFRLIDSYEDDNIDLAIAMMSQNQGMRAAAKHRYYPILRILDRNMGRGWAGLRGVREFIEHPTFPRLMELRQFIIFLAEYYLKLGHFERVAELMETGMRLAFSKLSTPLCFTMLAKMPAPLSVRVRRVEITDKNPRDIGEMPDARHFQELEHLLIRQHVGILNGFLGIAEQLPQLKKLEILGFHFSNPPAAWLSAPQLEKIDLSLCYIERLPDYFQEGQALKSLYLDRNPMCALPPSLARLTNLEYLSLRSTDIVAFPTWLRDMPSLQTVCISRKQAQAGGGEAIFSANLPPDCKLVCY